MEQHVKIVIENRGSGSGISYWSSFTSDPCARKLRLDAALREETEAAGPVLSEGDSGDAMNRGILFHKIAEYYHLGKLTHESIADGIDFATPEGTPHPAATGKAVSQALALAKFWILGVPKSGLGHVIGTEVNYPKTPGGIAAVSAAMGDALFTGAADIVTEIRSRSQAAEVAEIFTNMGAPLPMDLDPGVWLWDWKTVTDVGSAFRYESGWQEIAYPWLHKNDFPEHDVKGIIFVVIAIGRKVVPTPSVEVVMHPYPSDEKVQALIRWRANAERMRDALLKDDDSVNRFKCRPQFAKGAWCKHLTNGLCNGY